MRWRGAVGVLLTLAAGISIGNDELAEQLRQLDHRAIVLGTVRQPPLATMLARDAAARLRSANRADRRAWEEVKTQADWERFRSTRLEALRASLGDWPKAPSPPKVRRTGTHEGDGYRVDNLVIEARPGLPVTANLYRPARPAASMPGVLICHSHHQPKHTGARQDMAMTWARAGCLVLVPDHLGHGERRQHAFAESAPHDYHFRYDNGIQLHLVGSSLMGWLAWDLMRGVDVLLAQTGIDSKRIVLISEPAGGGDVAAVTAALDERIAGVVVNNFGGPQPETAYPLPRDAEESFEYAGSGSWESTRNLRLSARDGFLPWTIVAATAPRRLIYYHEFYWDRDQDPVWKRLQKVYGFYRATDALRGVAGRGFVVGSEPENTHWLASSREILYPDLQQWFAIPNPGKEYSKRRPAEELLALTPEASKEFRVEPLHAVLARLGGDRSAAARQELARLKPAERRDRLRQQWTRLLGTVVPEAAATVKETPPAAERLGTLSVERIQLGTEPGVVVPVLLLLPARRQQQRLPVVVCLAQEGKQAFLRQRSERLAELLKGGVAVCLLDVRGTGETSPGEARDRRSPASSIAATEWMLGQSLLGGRLRDLRAVLRFLRERRELNGKIALWGDSFAAINPANRDLKSPHTAASRPAQSEPLGGLLALLGALFEEVHAVHVRGGLCDYHSLLQAPYCYLPADAVVPDVLTTGDLCDVAAALAPCPVHLEGLVDGLNRAVSPQTLRERYAPALAAYEMSGAKGRLRLGESAEAFTQSLLGHLVGR